MIIKAAEPRFKLSGEVEIGFEDIKHIITNQKGIFVSKRNFVSLFGTLNYIKKNYNKIQKELRKNWLLKIENEIFPYLK